MTSALLLMRFFQIAPVFGGKHRRFIRGIGREGLLGLPALGRLILRKTVYRLLRNIRKAASWLILLHGAGSLRLSIVHKYGPPTIIRQEMPFFHSFFKKNVCWQIVHESAVKS